MSFLVTGSLAYDILYTHAGVFNDVIKMDAGAALSVGFNVQTKAVLNGGCAGNIAYAAACVGSKAYMLGVVGHDFAEYKKRFSSLSIDTKHVLEVPEAYTAQASVVTDAKGQQITFFYEGAGAYPKKYLPALHRTVDTLAKKISLVHVGPNSKAFMMGCIEAAKRNRLPFYFDPGQALPLFTKAELEKISAAAAGLFVNEYELMLLSDVMRVDLRFLVQQIPLVVVTLGKKGSDIHLKGKKMHIKGRSVRQALDPTGCGDAYRGGFLSIVAKSPQKLTPSIVMKAGELGTELATKCLVKRGTQMY